MNYLRSFVITGLFMGFFVSWVYAQPRVAPQVTGIVTDIDYDGDRILNEQDECPRMPGLLLLFGCPQIDFRVFDSSQGSGIIVNVPLWALEERFSYDEDRQIQEGDFFKAVFLHPKTQDVVGESNVLQVVK